MKPHNLIKMDDHKYLGNQSGHKALIETQDTSSIKVFLSSITAIVVVFCIFILTSYFASLLPGFDTKNEIVEPLTQQVQVPVQHIDAYMWTAKLKLEDLKLNHRLKITSNDQTEIRIDGNISVQETSNWNIFLKWYETKEGFPKLVHAVNTSETKGNIPELKSVWFDASPTAYFTDGRFGNIGTVFEDGWKIVGIEAWAVFIEREGTMITLNY